VLETVGVKNIVSKCLRSNNPHNLVKATINGLWSLRSREEIAASRGKTVEEILARRLVGLQETIWKYMN